MTLIQLYDQPATRYHHEPNAKWIGYMKLCFECDTESVAFKHNKTLPCYEGCGLPSYAQYCEDWKHIARDWLDYEWMSLPDFDSTH